MDTQEILEKIKQFPIAVAGIIVALVAGALFFIRGNAVPNTQAELDAAQKKLQTMSRNSSQSIGLKEDLEAIETFLSRVEEGSFDSTQRSTNINYFYSFEDDSNVRITAINHEEPIMPRKKGIRAFNELRKHAVIPIELEMEGGFGDLILLAHKIRAGEKLARIHSLELSAGNEIDPTMEMQITVEILGEYLGK